MNKYENGYVLRYIKLSLNTYYFEADYTFSTSHDYKVAKILANDLIQVYLENQLFDTAQTITFIKQFFLFLY